MYCVPIYLLILKIWKKRFVRGRKMQKYVTTIIIFLPKLTKKIYNFKKIVISLPYIDTKRNKKRSSFCYKMKKNKTEKASSISKAAQLQVHQAAQIYVQPKNPALSVIHSNFFINRLFFCRKPLFVMHICFPQSYKL